MVKSRRPVFRWARRDSDSRVFAVRGRERGTGFTYARDFSSGFEGCRMKVVVRTAVCEKLHSLMVCLRRPGLS